MTDPDPPDPDPADPDPAGSPPVHLDPELPPGAELIDAATGRATGPVSCGSCGAPPADPAHALVTWTRGVERGRTLWTCVDCSRRHLRGIEGRLDSQWW